MKKYTPPYQLPNSGGGNPGGGGPSGEGEPLGGGGPPGGGGHPDKPQQQIWMFDQLGPLQASSMKTGLWQTTSLMS